jgi:flagellar hook-associated protein 2
MATTVGSTSTTSAVSFQGLSSGLQTDSLVEALMTQASQPLVRLQSKQALNNQRSSLLHTLNSNLLALSSSVNNVNLSGLSANTVASSDANGTYVTATASGAANGNYSLTVNQVAVAAQSVYEGAISGTPSTYSLGGTAAAADQKYHYTVTGTDGNSTDIALSAATNTLAGLRDAINSSSSTSGVSASLVQLDSSGTSYALVLGATQTGLGATGGSTVSLALGTGSSDNSTSNMAAFISTTGKPAGLQNKTVSAQDAKFNLNGIDLTRSSNTVTDAVQGMTLTLKAPQATNTPATTLTVATDQAAATKSMQDVVDKFNAILKLYRDNSGTDSSGNPQALANDFNIRSMISSVRSKIMSSPSGLATGSAFSSAASLGLKTNRDGTMSLDSTAFKAALDKNPTDVSNVFTGAGTALVGYVNTVTSPGSGNLAMVLQSIDTQNLSVTRQISTMQTYLDRKRTILQNQYSKLETTVGQLQSVAKSLSGMSSTSA